MAFAFLRYKGKADADFLFQADIGTAKFFSYTLGEKKRNLKVGKNEFVEVLNGEKRRSKLMQINDARHKIGQGRFPLRIPESELTRNTKYVQLYSFNNRQNKAPTLSNIVRLYPNVGRELAFNKSNYGEMFTNEIEIMNHIPQTNIKNKAFSFSEPRMSKVMFWSTIVNALPTIVKHAAPIIGGLLKGGGQQPSSGSNTPAAGNQTNNVLNKVMEALQALAQNNASAATPSATTPNQATSAPQSLSSWSSTYSLEPETILGLSPILERQLSPEAILAIGDDPQKLFMAIKDMVQKTEGTVAIKDIRKQAKHTTNKKEITSGKYSEAKIAPAVLAALPALMPVLEKVLNPQMIEAIGNQPTKLFKAVGDTLLKMDEQEIKHLEAINPGVDSADDLAKLLQGMSISTAHKEDLIKFELIKNLNLKFIGTRTVNFKGKQRVLYSKKSRISLPYRLETISGNTLQKVLNKSIIQIVIKDAQTMKLVFRKNINLLDVNIGNDIKEAFLLPEEIAQIPCNTELKLELSHIWKSNKNKNIGVFKCHYVHFLDSYLFDRIGEAIANPIPLNDINIHRKFWHKIWEGGFSKSNRWEVAFDLKYFYLLNNKEDGIARLETRKQITQDNVEEGQEHPKRRKIQAKLKSGLELSLNSINELLALLNQETLEEPLIKILLNSSLEKEFQQVARQRVEMKGREGDTATLWSYPEISLHKLYLSKEGKTDEMGQVVLLEPIEKTIPKPTLIHFIGTKSER